MGFDVLEKINKAGQASGAYIQDSKTYIKKRWSSRHVSEAERRRIEERNRFLQLVAAKVTGTSRAEMPPLTCGYDPNRDPTNAASAATTATGVNRGDGRSSKAVFLVTVPIAFGPFELSRSTYKLLARHLGMSLNSVSHWALCVVDRRPDDDGGGEGEGKGEGGGDSHPSYCYDLMSDHLTPMHALGRNYFRVYEITPEFIETWTSCYYVGETTKTHDVIQQLGYNFMAVHPRYNLLTNNCQNLVETMVRLLCDGKVVSQAMLNEELSLLSPKIARDLMVARLRSKLDALKENEEPDDIKEDVDVIKAWIHKIKNR